VAIENLLFDFELFIGNRCEKDERTTLLSSQLFNDVGRFVSLEVAYEE
jgi:hypothetical protein